MTDRQLAQIAARVDAAIRSGIWTGESMHDIVPLLDEAVRLRQENADLLAERIPIGNDGGGQC